MKDARGRWHDPAPRDDGLLVAPILRQAGFDKVRFNDEVLYTLQLH